tara:strand:- start:2938 stop:4836 length:1899 start_codon:yes stop_codon:yes gene_type:complete
MAVNLSPVGGVAGQFFDNNGNPLAGGKLYTYSAGTTTPQTTFTNSLGTVLNSNPIILNSGGRVPSEIWLTDGLAYKFVLYTSADVLLGTWDNISGINSNFVNFTNSQEIQTATSGQTVFTLATMEYQAGTNSLTVYVDGVNQYGPGALYAYVETNSTTITFNSGLHVGAEVKFTTSAQNTSSATDAGQISFTGFNGQVGTVQDLADDDGSDWVGFLPAGTGAVAQSVQTKLRETVSVKDFGAVGDGVTDDTAAIQAAADAAKTEKKALFIPAPTVSYLISSTITFNDINVYGESAADFTQFKATTEFTAFKIYASLGTIENIGVSFDLGSPATSAVGFEFASTASIFDNVRQSKFYQLNVRNAYNGFQTAASGGTIALAVFELCRSALHTNIGFNFKASPGSTNFTLINCFSQGILGGASKGVILDSIKDVTLINLSIDACLDVNLKVTDVSVLGIDNIAFEAPKLTLNNAKIIDLTNVSTNINKIIIQGLTVDVGAGNSAFIVGGGGSTYNTRIGEIRQQTTTTTSGTLFKHRPGTPSNGAYQINDSNCTYTDISYGGFDALIVLNNRQSVSSFASMLGSWVQGDFVWNRSTTEVGTTPNKYVVIGWSRLTSGSANVLNTDWVESRVLTGN